MRQLFLSLGAFSGFTSVALGAFAAHVLKDSLSPALLSSVRTAAQYQMYHALALILIALLLKHSPEKLWLTISGSLFATGTFLFSGSLYALALTENPLFGPITPLGGLCLLLGWASLFVATFKID